MPRISRKVSTTATSSRSPTVCPFCDVFNFLDQKVNGLPCYAIAEPSCKSKASVAFETIEGSFDVPKEHVEI